MKVTRFASTADLNPPRFAPKVQILGFGFAVGLVLLTAFNGQHLVKRMADSHANDAVSLAYLRIWIRAKPDAYHLRLVLARHELSQGNLQLAEDAVAPILSASDVDHDDLIDAQTLMLDINKQEMWRLKPNTPAYIRAQAQYLKQLRKIASYHWDLSHLQSFAQEATILGDSQLSHDLYTSLIKNHPCSNLSWYDIVARADLGNGHYGKAAHTYFLASSCTKDPVQQRTYVLTGLKALQSGNRLNDAIQASENYSALLLNDPKALMFLAKLALASNRPDLAEKYISRLLQQRITTTQGTT